MSFVPQQTYEASYMIIETIFYIEHPNYIEKNSIDNNFTPSFTTNSSFILFFFISLQPINIQLYKLHKFPISYIFQRFYQAIHPLHNVFDSLWISCDSL